MEESFMLSTAVRIISEGQITERLENGTFSSLIFRLLLAVPYKSFHSLPSTHHIQLPGQPMF
jgi:hypothetical protein